MDLNWILAQVAPMLIRYGVFGVCAALVALGFTDEQVAGMNPLITQLVGAIVGLIVLVIAAKLKPSVKAALAAREIDAKVPADAPVEIMTPAGQPDILVPGKGA